MSYLIFVLSALQPDMNIFFSFPLFFLTYFVVWVSESDVKLLIHAERRLEKSKFTTNFSMEVFQVYNC